MKLVRVSVSNFRNINGITVDLNPTCSYIIGENNLGKSNFLSLLDTVFNSSKGFDESDFSVPEKPIEIEVDIKMHPSEFGFLRDNFSPEDATTQKLRYIQRISDAYPTVVCTDTNESLSSKDLKKINFLRYETTSAPSKELRLDNNRGAGMFVSGLIERFLDEGDHDFLNTEQANSVVDFINSCLNKIPSFRDYSIKAMIAQNKTDMLTSLIYLSDGERKIDTTGSGIQYIAMASINILYQIMALYKSKAIPFKERLYTNDEGLKLLPLVLSIDEPEVHLHPYLQRSLIGYYKKILGNRDPEFSNLLRKCFEINGLDGQLIIVTHSTDALVGDYRNLIRFYKYGGNIQVISGLSLCPVVGERNKRRITPENEKHILMHFPYIKESFYAKCAILFEGETEYGCISSFADKIGIPLDDYGICAINARGESSIESLRRLLGLFGIPTIAIYDRDVKGNREARRNDFYTSEPCFEIEIVKTLYKEGKQALVKKIAFLRDANYESDLLDYNWVCGPFRKFGIDLSIEETCPSCGNKQKIRNLGNFTPRSLSSIPDEDEEMFCLYYSAWFIAKKGIMLGRIIGDSLTSDLIPESYSRAIQKAKEVATHGLR